MSRAIAEEWPSEQLDQAISEMSTFGEDKARTMSVNALALISGQAARTTAYATGAHEKRSMSVHDNKVCVACKEDEHDGWIGVNDDFSGSDTPDVPHHFNCRCSCEYRWMEIPSALPDLTPEQKAYWDRYTGKRVAAYSDDQPRDKSGEWTSDKGDSAESTDNVERIKSPAMKFPSGKSYEGVTHTHAHDAGLAAGEPPSDFVKFGYTTTKGRFVGSEEARTIAQKAKQISLERKGRLKSEELNKGKYLNQGDVIDPKTGMIRAYSPDQPRDKSGEWSSGGTATEEPEGKIDILAIALKNHGETHDIQEAGYVLPDGKLPNMSEGNTGKRNIEHENIDIPEIEQSGQSRTK